MTGLEFEQFLARLLPHLGYADIVLTPINDQGGDILCTAKSGERVVVQAKRWKGSLGNAVVQEILGAMLHYSCSCGMIITNSTFTAAAYDLAGKDTRISLHDGAWLASQIEMHLPPEIPPFDWRRYHSEVVPRRCQMVSHAIMTLPIASHAAKISENSRILARLAAGEISVQQAIQLLADATREKKTVSGRKRHYRRRRRYR